MIYSFNYFELDLTKMELRQKGQAISVEPQVFDLLRLLIENRDRMVSKDEILDNIWVGRVVSESALSSRIKSVRQVLGDSGKTQTVIRTIRGRGFRFIADVTELQTPIDDAVVSVQQANTHPRTPEKDSPTPLNPQHQRPSVAVLPFQWLGSPTSQSIICEALPHELIVALSRLRWLAVIARGSTFQLNAQTTSFQDIGRILNAGYCVSGYIEKQTDDILVTVDLIDSRDSRVLWGNQYQFKLSTVHDIRAQIVSSIVMALDVYIPRHEASIASLISPESLDAWAEYHLGLQAMYRFTQRHNEKASCHFKHAIKLDKHFSRAHAGLSFTRFQDAFMNYVGDRETAEKEAQAYAERSVELDPEDPFANFNLGRSYLLRGDFESSVNGLDRCIELCPNFAQGLYSRGWVELMASSAVASREFIDKAMRLSPLDPLLYAMLGTRALSYIEENDFPAASYWAEKAASSPRSHVFVGYIAAVAHALAGNEKRSLYWTDNVRQRRPDITRQEFFKAFPFAKQAMRRTFDDKLNQLGL